MLVASGQSDCLTFGDFRRRFKIAADSGKVLTFKRDSDANEWMVPAGDSDVLPVVEGVIIGEALTDY